MRRIVRWTRTQLSLLVISAGVASIGAQAQTAGVSLIPADGGASAMKHFDTLGKPPSKFTLELRNGFKAELPFADKRDFDEAKRGFIAAPLTRRSWRTPAMSPGTWAAMAGC